MEVWFFIIGYLLQMFGSLMLLLNISKRKSVYGLSSDTQICFLASTISRVIWSRETRLIETYLAYVELMLSVFAAITLCFAIWRFRHTTTQEAWWPLRAFVLLPTSFMVSLFFHPGGSFVFSQILVAFTMYSEALALLPQLYLMQKMIEVEPLTSHYVGVLTVSRLIRLLFWFSLYWRGEHFLGLFLADFLHTLLAADYLYLWCRKLRTGGTLIYKL